MSNTKSALIWIAALATIVAGYLLKIDAKSTLANTSVITGYLCLVIMLFLMAFNARKKLSVVPAVSARIWLAVHISFGVALIPLYFIHTNSLWPTGLYEQIIALLFGLVALSGLTGYMLKLALPSRLRHLGTEIIYERIPEELYLMREAVKELILHATQTSGHETLSREYTESMAWFFTRPRFYLSHLLGSGHGLAWIDQKERDIQPFLADVEKDDCLEIFQLMRHKNSLDAQYAIQSTLKGWLLIHLPIAFALIVFVLWHVVLVHLYAL